MLLLIWLVLACISLLVAFVLPVLSFLRASRALLRIEALERDVAALRAQLAAVPRAADISADAMAGSAAAKASADGSESRAYLAEAPADAVAGSAAAKASTDRLESRPYQAPHSLEERIGARWLLYAGIAALVLGVSYFIKFAFDNGWVSEPLRVLVGLLAGSGLLVAGQRFVARGLAFFGHALSGGGIVVLYVAIYAALHVYGLIGPTAAFVAMAGVTLVATALADRHRMEILGALAVAGGFATPMLVGGEQDAQVVLCTYVAILLAGTLALVARHGWAGIAPLAYVLTGLTWIDWAASFYTPEAWLRTLLFLSVHLVLIMGMVVVLRRAATPSIGAAPATWLLLTAPVAYHTAALLILGRFHGRLLVYLLLATVAGLSATYHAGWRLARTGVLILVALPLIQWMTVLRLPRWYSGAIITACAVYLLHLAGQWRDLSDDPPDRSLPFAEIVHTHATGLFLPLALYVFFADRFSWWNPPLLTAAAVWNGGIAALLRRRAPMLWWHFGTLAATFAALAVSEWFDGPIVAIGWAMEGAALGWAALRAPHAAELAPDAAAGRLPDAATGRLPDVAAGRLPDVAAGLVRRLWLLRASLFLFVLSAFRLVAALTQPMPLGSLPLFNTRALAALIVVGAMAWLAARVKETPDLGGREVSRHALILGAHVLTVGWISAEIGLVFGEQAYASSAADLPASAARAELSEQVALSVAWALYAVGLVAAGFRRQYAPARYLAIALFGLTIVKVITKDIAELDRVYQMLSVLAVGALLVSASYLYQRMAAARDASARAAPAVPDAPLARPSRVDTPGATGHDHGIDG